VSQSLNCTLGAVLTRTTEAGAQAPEGRIVARAPPLFFPSSLPSVLPPWPRLVCHCPLPVVSLPQGRRTETNSRQRTDSPGDTHSSGHTTTRAANMFNRLAPEGMCARGALLVRLRRCLVAACRFLAGFEGLSDRHGCCSVAWSDVSAGSEGLGRNVNLGVNREGEHRMGVSAHATNSRCSQRDRHSRFLCCLRCCSFVSWADTMPFSRSFLLRYAIASLAGFIRRRSWRCRMRAVW
jgi:hypothetical protein